MNKTINFFIVVLLAVTFCMYSLADEPQTSIPPELVGAKWISGDCSQGLPVFRKEFELSQPAENVVSATASICGLGFYQLDVNGETVTITVKRI